MTVKFLLKSYVSYVVFWQLIKGSCNLNVSKCFGKQGHVAVAQYMLCVYFLILVVNINKGYVH